MRHVQRSESYVSGLECTLSSVPSSFVPSVTLILILICCGIGMSDVGSGLCSLVSLIAWCACLIL